MRVGLPEGDARLMRGLAPKSVTSFSLPPQAIAECLTSAGHVLVDEPREAAVYGVSVEADGFIYANADYRKGGDVAGVDPVTED